MNKPVPRPRSGVGKPSSKPGLPPTQGPRKPGARPGSGSSIKPKTPPEEVEAAAEEPEREEHPSSKLRRMKPLKSGAPQAPPPEPLDRSMRSAGMPLAAKFAIMIGVTVAATSFTMAIFIHTKVVGEVDKEINDAGVRTTRILCGLDTGTIRGSAGAGTVISEYNKLAPAVNDYTDYMTKTLQQLVDQTGIKLPDDMKQEKEGKFNKVKDALKGVADGLKGFSSAGGIFTGNVDAKKVPGLLNVVITDETGKIALSILDAQAGSLSKGSNWSAITKTADVDISEGRVSGTTVRQYRSVLHDKDGAAVGYVEVYLSAAKIEEVKSNLFTVMLIPLFISVVLGIGIAVFIAARVTKPIQLLVSDINAVSRGDLDHETVAHSTDEIGVLAKAFDRMTQGLKAAHETELDKKAAEHELTIAAEIQSNLLPKKIPKIPGYDISAYYRPSKEVGGDLYDFIQIDQENLAILIADVSGKGVPGSMIMTMARSLLRMEGERNLSTADTLVKTNRILARDIRRGMFVTCMYMILNARDRTLLISSAGHNPLVVFRKQTGQIELVNPNGIALGFDKGPIFERTVKEQKIQLYPGDRFCTYTDGVPEAMSPEDEEFGDDKFYGLCKSLAGVDSNQFVNRIVKELDDHKGDREQHDDITLVTVRLV